MTETSHSMSIKESSLPKEEIKINKQEINEKNYISVQAGRSTLNQAFNL